MSDVIEVEDSKIAAMKPVAMLIGWLLLLNGIDHVVALLNDVYNYIQYQNNGVEQLHNGVMQMIQMMQNGIESSWYLRICWCLLGIAGIIAGIGLIKLAPWARRVAIVVLLGLLAYWILYPLLRILQYPEALSHIVLLRSPLYNLTRTALLNMPSNLLMLLFLMAPQMRTLWHDSRPPGIIGEIARKMMRVFPPTLAPLVIFIWVMLLCWAVKALPAVIFSFSTTGTFNFLFNFLSSDLSFSAYVIVGALLLFRQDLDRRTGAIILSCIALLIGGGILVAMVIAGIENISSGASPLTLLIFPTIGMLITAITSIGTYAVLAWFLWKSAAIIGDCPVVEG